MNGKIKSKRGLWSRLRCVEVVAIPTVQTTAGNDFPADRADFDRNFHRTEEVFRFFDPKKMAGMPFRQNHPTT